MNLDLETIAPIAHNIAADFGGGSAIDKICLMARLADHLDLRTFAEIGVWRGRLYFPLACSFRMRGGMSYGIDPYDRNAARQRDTPEHIQGEVRLFIENTDYEDVFSEVTGRHARLALERHSKLVRKTSLEAARELAQEGVRLDLLHLDGNHDREAVLADIAAFSALMRPRGIIVVDDIDWPSVQPAFEALAARHALVHRAETFAVFALGRTPGEADALTAACSGFAREAAGIARQFAGRPAPKLSVSMITYNQEAFVGRALESILRQDTDFDFEIVISDDASTDGTHAICEAFARAHPERIRLSRNRENIGPVRNYLQTYARCAGDYIAYLEGDDFWLNPIKLQRQVDFLDAHPDYVISCHNVLTADADGVLGAPLLDDTVKQSATVRDLVQGDFIATAACVTRNLRLTFPGWIDDLPGCDWIVDILHAEHGRIRYFPESMAAYRRHPGAIWSSRSRYAQLETTARMISRMDRGLNRRYSAEFTAMRGHARRAMAAMRAESRAGAIRRMVPASLVPALRAGRRGLSFLGRRMRGPARPTAAAPAVVTPDRAPAAPLPGEVAPPPCQAGLIILDDCFPHPQSAFRYAEYTAYLRAFPDSRVLTSGESLAFFQPAVDFPTLVRNYETANPDLRGRVHHFDRAQRIEAELAYMLFAGNTFQNLDFVERNAIPFVFTLYPGGMFLMNDAASDARLRRIFESPMFRRVIVTQKATAAYLDSKKLCPPAAVEMIYGVVGAMPPDVPGAVPHRRYGYGKETIDLCFVAHKYMAGGYDKGFDRFMKVASLLARRDARWRFHVVGNYAQADFPVAGLEGRIEFHGPQDPAWFETFYRDKDAILLCNRPFVLLDGAFDGFPTGCGSDAMLREVALFCTDPLNLNCRFEDGRDLVIVEGRPARIAETMSGFADDPARLKSVGEYGARQARLVYSPQEQMTPRLSLLAGELAKGARRHLREEIDLSQ